MTKKKKGYKSCWLMTDISKQLRFWGTREEKLFRYSNGEQEGHLSFQAQWFISYLDKNKTPLEKTMNKVHEMSRFPLGQKYKGNNQTWLKFRSYCRYQPQYFYPYIAFDFYMFKQQFLAFKSL